MMASSEASRLPRKALLVLAAIVTLPALPGAGLAQENGDLGKGVYDRWCAGCHGDTGAGDGPAAAYMLPRPRDFTRALYQVRTTATGQLPTDEDLMRIIDVGMPGTAMPGWEDVLSREERRAVAQYLKSFSRYFASVEAPDPIDIGSPTEVTPEGLVEGREIFAQVDCGKCHGTAGRGDGPSAPTMEDDLGFPIRAADLSENWNLNGGGAVEDIYARFRTGMDGTPMPSNSDLLDAGILTEAQLWNLAHYVRSLSPDDPPALSEVIRADLSEAKPLPSEVDDPVWDEVDRFYIPLVGQIIRRPRWFQPQVDGVWVQALHDGQELALRITWSDPSRSPDSEWAPWRERLIQVMEPGDDVPFEEGPLPDRLDVQFPMTAPDGVERPFFLMGSPGDPVSIWSWNSDQPRAREAVARGAGSTQILPDGEQDLASDMIHQDGQWRILLRRSLTTEQPGSDVQLPVGEAMPIAFFAWDGDSGEAGSRGAVSSWYYVLLRQKTPVTVYVAPSVALLLTAVFGLGLVSRAQKGEPSAP